MYKKNCVIPNPVVDLKDAKKQACPSLNAYLKDATACLN